MNTENNKDDMRSFVEKYTLFIDTCSLLAKGSGEFFCKIIQILREFNKSIIVPYRVYEELEKHSRNKEKPYLAKDASQWLDLLPKLQKAGIIEVRGESTDNFADNVFQVVFTKFRMTHNLLLITQDNNLAKDILNLNNNRSVLSKKEIVVKRINDLGLLDDFYWNGESNTSTDENQESNKPKLKPEEIFKICKNVTNIPDDVLNVGYIPRENDIVETSRGQITLVEEIAAGGEGIIYTTNTPYVAKIYKKDNNTRRRYEKIKLMLSKKMDCEGICTPVEPIYNSRNEFVGYLMPSAKGKEIQKSIFIKPLFLKKFPGWKKRDTVELCITILEKIKYLHDRNVIMGDINPANILVVSPKEVYFVDTDSYQVEDFPCPVGTVNYTAPEIQRKRFSEFLRTMGNENFAVATLLFMIMLPGKPPYSQQGGEDPINNILQMDFSYPFGDNSNKKTPDGPWRYIWSHLTYQLKAAFYETFRKNECHSQENSRYDVDYWLDIFHKYLYLLDSGKFAEQDPMSEELYPTRHKRNPKMKYVICKLCGKEVPESRCQEGICKECLNDGEVYRCKKCGKEMLYTNYQKYVKHSKKFDVCSDCFDEGNEVYITETCVDCGCTFNITNKEHEFYVSKGYDLPKRCKKCRESRRNNNVYGGYNYNDNDDDDDDDDESSRSNYRDDGCFITTAVCEYFGKEDDCIELTTLRDYRDHWLAKQQGGLELIKEYYAIGPEIVRKLKGSQYYEAYCETLWREYLAPCLAMIAEGRLEDCKYRYIAMVKYMQGKFA